MMKTSLTVGVFVVLILSFTGLCFAADAPTTLAWDYLNPPVDLAGFELRVNGDNSIIIDIDPDARTWTGTLDINDDLNKFELRAKDLGGQVSVWAEAYHDPVPSQPSITVIIVQSQ